MNLHSIIRSSACALVLVVGAAGCASTMSKKDCERTDFYKLGMEHGEDGKNAEGLAKANNECQRHGVAVPAEKYTYGHRVGLADYCSEKRGKNDAKDGKTDSICLAEKVPPYQAGYNAILNERRQEQAEKVAEIQKEKNKVLEKENQETTKLNEIEKQRSTVPNL